MTSVRVAVLAAVVFILGAHAVAAQGLSTYREYTLGASVASIFTTSGARASDVRTLHERPVRIQELQWRAPYVLSGTPLADPVHDIVFSFYDDQLYQVVVSYDVNRMGGLTNDDVIDSVSATYGLRPLLQAKPIGAPSMADILGSTTIVAQWEGPASLITVTRGTYSSQVQLLLISKALHGRALAGIKEGLRLDANDAPKRELDRQKKAAADALVLSEKARVLNKPAFRP